MKMTPKQRLLALMRGEEADRMSWSPFLAYWWECHPEKAGVDQLDYMESVGADPLLRGFAMPFSFRFGDSVEITSVTKGNTTYETWSTSVGKLVTRYDFSPNGNTRFRSDFPVKTVEDVKTLIRVYEDLQISEEIAATNEAYDRVGERGLLLPLVGAEAKTCFQSLVEKWIGTENLAYLACDEPELIDELICTMRRVSDPTARMCAESKPEAFIFWEDSSTTNINPAMFERWTAPEIKFWADTLHSVGKLLVHHACGHLKGLLKNMACTGADVIESMSPPPTGNIDIPEAFALLPENIAIIGGIEPTFFSKCTAEELEERISYLTAVCKNRRLLLANSDSCPPEVEEWKFGFVSEKVRGK